MLWLSIYLSWCSRVALVIVSDMSQHFSLFTVRSVLVEETAYLIHLSIKNKGNPLILVVVYIIKDTKYDERFIYLIFLRLHQLRNLLPSVCTKDSWWHLTRSNVSSKISDMVLERERDRRQISTNSSWTNSITLAQIKLGQLN